MKLTRYVPIAALFLCSGMRADVIFTLIPAGGAVTGAPGQTVGWGFTLDNTTDYLVVTSADFVTVAPVGTFTDFISPAFLVIGPSPELSSVTQFFSASAFTGVGSYAIDATATVGGLSLGKIQLTYDLYSVSPNDPAFDPTTSGVLISSGNLLEADASVEVVAGTSAVPEPGSLVLLGTMLALFGIRVARQKGPAR